MKVANQLTLNGDVVLDYPVDLALHNGPLKAGNGGRTGQSDLLWEDLSQPLLALKVEKRQEPRNPGASRSWERPGKGFFPRVPRRSAVLPTPCFSSVETHVGLLTCRTIRSKFVWFKSSFVEICYGSHRKLIHSFQGFLWKWQDVQLRS